MTASGNDINQTIEGCIRGDRKSQQQIFENYYGKMLGICMRYTRDVDEAKDVLQDGFIKVFNNIGKFNQSGSLESWIRRIVVNTAIDYYRKNRNAMLSLDENYQFGEEDENLVDEADDAYGGYKPEEVMKAVQQLSPAYRIVFNMYVVEDYSHKEIAEELNISIGTSKSNLAKAKKNLKKILLKKEFITDHG